MTGGLLAALRGRGIRTELVTRPFRFSPPSEVLRAMNEWEGSDADTYDIGHVDRVICLSFPSFYLRHRNKVVWLMHQHRAVYELFGTNYGADDHDEDAIHLKAEITQRDTASLGAARNVFTISQRVSSRLHHFNDIESTPLYQPPAHSNRYYCSSQLPYIFVPSRLEALKRQDLVFRALAEAHAPVALVVAGEGGCRAQFERLVEESGLESRVRFLGRVDQDEMYAWYANSLAVFFGPYEEDYGFVTLEAMLSSKPVLTCADSGGPLEFVIHGETGFVCSPEPRDIAARIDWLWRNREAARDMGHAGRTRYESLGISWDSVVDTLLA